MNKSFPNYISKKTAWLIDPEKVSLSSDFKRQLTLFPAHQIILVGGSTCTAAQFTETISFIYKHATCLILIFPGNNKQIDGTADGILLLSLVSGRNPDYLIAQHIAAAQVLKKSNLTILPTGYILIDGEITSSTNQVTQTPSIASNQINLIENTALASTQLGMNNIYLEAGSGAIKPIDFNTIFTVRAIIDNNTLWVGGGIKTKEQINLAHSAGANVVVIGNAIEKEPHLLKALFE
jgi:phosphoglycerol geranylgeranyltransferase